MGGIAERECQRPRVSEQNKITGLRASGREREKLTPMKPPAPHTSTVMPAPLPIVIGIVSGRLFPRVQRQRTALGQCPPAAARTAARARRPAARPPACAAPPSRTRRRTRARMILSSRPSGAKGSSSTPLPRARLCAPCARTESAA